MAPFTNAFGIDQPQLDRCSAPPARCRAAPRAPPTRKVDDYLIDNAWFVPLFSLSATIAVAPTVANVQAPSLLEHHDRPDRADRLAQLVPRKPLR